MKDLIYETKKLLKEYGPSRLGTSEPTNDPIKTRKAMKTLFGWLNNLEEDEISNLKITDTGATFDAHGTGWSIKITHPGEARYGGYNMMDIKHNGGAIKFIGTNLGVVIILCNPKQQFLGKKQLDAAYEILGHILSEGKFKKTNVYVNT